MSLVWFTDKVTQQKVAINPEYVVAVFTASEGELKDTTIISLVNGTIPVVETDIEVVASVSGV